MFRSRPSVSNGVLDDEENDVDEDDGRKVAVPMRVCDHGHDHNREGYPPAARRSALTAVEGAKLVARLFRILHALQERRHTGIVLAPEVVCDCSSRVWLVTQVPSIRVRSAGRRRKRAVHGSDRPASIMTTVVVMAYRTGRRPVRRMKWPACCALRSKSGAGVVTRSLSLSLLSLTAQTAVMEAEREMKQVPR